ncbi:sugar ABC transporter permease [Paenibacillus glycanilyticus]|uniref:Sugar ABC transporter permease n=1 Tax=Paenibacillus glycanilyticus TaxID=126569 RepID=A0ABQ6GE34_9BACL|nr:sugar ABC transporter permease [Paenibacillus glycanilyticus]
MLNKIKSQKILLLFLIPAMIAVFVFNYLPLVGLSISFLNYQPAKGLFGSDFAGLEHFRTFLKDPEFYSALKNTLGIGGLLLLFGYPAPIFLALMIDNVRNARFKKVTQSVTYLPHFISWVIFSGLVYEMLDVDNGIINVILMKLGIEPISFMSSQNYFWTILVSSSILKEIGWGTILYLAAISAINPEEYEAASVDGAGKLARIWHVTIPGIAPTMVLVFLLSLGGLLSVNFDAIYNMINPLVQPKAEVLGYYTFRTGIMLGKYSYSTAIELVNSLISFLIVLISLKIAKRFADYSVI